MTMKDAELQLKALRRAVTYCKGGCKGLGPPTCPYCTQIRSEYNELLKAYDASHDLFNPVVGGMAKAKARAKEDAKAN